MSAADAEPLAIAIATAATTKRFIAHSPLHFDSARTIQCRAPLDSRRSICCESSEKLLHRHHAAPLPE
jgi:hypothetical protein